MLISCGTEDGVQGFMHAQQALSANWDTFPIREIVLIIALS